MFISDALSALWLMFCLTPLYLHKLSLQYVTSMCINVLLSNDIQATGKSTCFRRVMCRRKQYTPARLSCTPLWSMRVPLTRLLNGSKAVMLSMAGCFFPRYSYEPLHSEFRANTPLGTGESVREGELDRTVKRSLY